MNLEKPISFRLCMILGFIACFILLGSAYFLEYVLKWIPCPLCQFQRIVFWIILLFFLLAYFHYQSHKFRIFYISSILFLAMLGIGLSGWQIWLQHSPNVNSAPCTASISALFKYYPLLEALKLGLNTHADCAKESYVLLGLSLAQWSLIAFSGFFVYGILLLFYIKKGRIQ